MAAVVVAQVLFSLGSSFCLFFDSSLLISVVRQRFFTSHNQNLPFVYIISMAIFGITGKFAYILYIISWPISTWIDPENGYESYRQFIGKEITLIGSISYVTPLFLNCLMTIHRVVVIASPVKSAEWFSENRLVVYCLAVTASVLTLLLIPYFSACSINFDAPSTTLKAACAPDRHPVTLFQNNNAIFLPFTALAVNIALILYMKYQRKRQTKQGVSGGDEAHEKRENAMIRQAAFIAFYFSLYETSNLYARLAPEDYSQWPIQVQNCIYYFRLFSICSLNFFVYFVSTKSTRCLVLQFLKLRVLTSIAPATITHNATRS